MYEGVGLNSELLASIAKQRKVRKVSFGKTQENDESENRIKTISIAVTWRSCRRNDTRFLTGRTEPLFGAVEEREILIDWHVIVT